MGSREKEMSYDALVIGGGPAGIFSALALKNHFKRVALLEKNDRLGKKLLLSGSGQCNLTHEGSHEELLVKYGGKKAFLKPAIKGFDNMDLIEFFQNRGLQFEMRNGGKYFPASGRASDVLDVLLQALRESKVDVLCNARATSVFKEDGGFKVESSEGTFFSGILVLATGGLSYPSTGSSGDGYELAARLGHGIIPLKPALSPLICETCENGHLAGISFESSEITLWRSGRKIGFFKGPLLFTHDGLSGPVILNNSRDFEPGDRIEINYIPMFDRSTIEREMTERAAQKNPPGMKRFLKEIGLTERFSIDRMKKAEIDDKSRISDLSKHARKKLAKALTEDACIIKKVKGFHIAMATSGGVDTGEINRKTMESKVAKGLFFAGEIIDIDGETGGYNLQAAFSTAWAIGNRFK